MLHNQQQSSIYPDAIETTEIKVFKDDGLYAVSTITCVVPGSLAATAANYTTSCFIADRNYKVVSIVERHDVAGTDAGAVTADVRKAASGTDIGSGTTLLTGTFNLKAAADTNVTGTVVVGSSLSTGQSVGLVSSGTLTAVSGVTVTIRLRAI